MFRQDFEKGKSILESGEVIVSSLTCPAGDDGPMKPICMCIGAKKETSCGNCGTKDWICTKTSKNNKWISDDNCKNQGLCNPYLDEDSQSCAAKAFRSASATTTATGLLEYLSIPT